MTLTHVSNNTRTQESKPYPRAWLLADSYSHLAAIISQTSWVVFQGLCSGPLPGCSVWLECLQQKQFRKLFSSTHKLLLGHQYNCTTLKKGLGLGEAETEENRTGKKKGRLMIDENSCKQEQFSLIMPLVLFHRIATLFNARSSIYHSAAAIPIVISTRTWALCLPLFDIWYVFINNFIFKRNFCDQLRTHSIRNFLSETLCWVFFTAWICAFPPRLSLPFSPSVAASGTPVLSPTQ